MKGDDIAERLLAFADQAVRVARALPNDATGKHVARQLIRSSTGGGANYEEGRGAESRADFAHKVSIAAKEIRESGYWLRLIERAEMASAEVLGALIREANELVAILTSSAKTAKDGSRWTRAGGGT
jgi:four helix bundle protein